MKILWRMCWAFLIPQNLSRPALRNRRPIPRIWCISMMRFHVFIPALIAGVSLIAAGPLITDASLIAQTEADVRTCAQCASVCGLCPPELYCSACFDKGNCYACPYTSSCSPGKDSCPCYDYCSKGICKGTDDCVGDLVSFVSFWWFRSLTKLRLHRRHPVSFSRSAINTVRVSA